MALVTLKVMASLLQLHGPGATIQSDHQGIDALLGDMRAQDAQAQEMQGQEQNQAVIPDKGVVTQAAFRRGAFAKGYGGGAFRRSAGVAAPGAFRRGFARAY
jgi:hypothetical protein